MRLGPVGPRGLTLLAAAGVAGLVLAAHGWAHRTTSGVPASLAGPSASAQVAPTATPGGARTQPAAGPSAPTGAAVHGGAPGPLLAAQPFAQYAFAIWPGTQSAAAKVALTGLTVSVQRKASGLSITASVNGQKPGPAHFYPRGARVYVVEASMGDDSGSSDYNLGDDGLAVTDSQGRIIS
jgi:hypothetical protein